MASHFGIGDWLFGDPTTSDDLRRWVAVIADGGADTYAPEVYFDGYCAYYRSELCESWSPSKFARFDKMMDEGTMPLEVYIDEARQRGIELFTGFRINDRHGVNKPFFKEHPDWLLKDVGHGVDYSIPEVRDWMFGIIEEVPNRFDVDGIEISFIRHGHCFPFATAVEQHPVMTEFMRRVRKMLDEVGEKKGRRLVLGARVPPAVGECRDLGFDVGSWASEGLIDYLAPSDYHCTDFNRPHDKFAELTRGTDCYLYPAIQADLPGGEKVMSLDNCRAAAQNFYGAGADGISTHNYDVYMWGQLRSKHYAGVAEGFPAALDYFKILRDPEAVAAGDRHYVFLPIWPDDVWPHDYRRLPIPHVKAVLDRGDPDQRAEYRFRICEHLPETVDLPVDKIGCYSGVFNQAGKVPGVWLIFRAIGMGPGDEIAVDINGHDIPDGDIHQVWYRDGRPAWEGRVLPPYTECRLSLTAPPGVYGDNQLGLKLLKSAASSDVDIVVDELEVIVHLED
jgi:hypothetical protein